MSVQKTYKNAWLKTIIISSFLSIRQANLDKFAQQTYNQLAYKVEVSGSLASQYLFSLQNYYCYDILQRYINLNLLGCRFISIIFYRLSIFQSSDNDATFTGFVLLLVYIFKYYCYKSTYLFEFCLYAYFITILVVNYKESNR